MSVSPNASATSIEPWMFDTFEYWMPTVLAQSGGLTPRRPAAIAAGSPLHSTGWPATWSDDRLVESRTIWKISSSRYDRPKAAVIGPAPQPSQTSPLADSSATCWVMLVMFTLASWLV